MVTELTILDTGDRVAVLLGDGPLGSGPVQVGEATHERRAAPAIGVLAILDDYEAIRRDLHAINGEFVPDYRRAFDDVTTCHVLRDVSRLAGLTGYFEPLNIPPGPSSSSIDAM